MRMRTFIGVVTSVSAIGGPGFSFPATVAGR
jgi:hypothetical protein